MLPILLEINAGISRIPPNNLISCEQPRCHGTVEEHLRLLESGRVVLQKMAADPRIKDASTPILLHPDLHKRNIFVSEDDPTKITAIIDWQSTPIEPAFWHADQVPDFAQLVPHPSLEDQPEPKSELCAQVHEACTQFLVPSLAGPRKVDDALFRPFSYCYGTWKDGAVAFRHELIETSRRWEELGFAGCCPFPVPTSEEFDIHQKEYQRFVTAHDLRTTVSTILNSASDGWVPIEEWESANVAHRELFEGMLEVVLTNDSPDDDEPLRSEADLREIWPFEL